MVIERTAQTGAIQKIYPLDRPLLEQEVRVSFTPAEDPEAMLDREYNRYSEMKNAKGEPGVYIPHWRELILVFKGLSPNVNLSGLELEVATSFHSQALRRGCVEDITPATVLGITRTSDDKIMYGVRGGTAAPGAATALVLGQANTIPGGHVTPQTTYSPNVIFSSFFDELLGEGGIERKQTSECSLIGYQTDPQFKSLCFAMRTQTSFSSQELAEMHTRALEVYQKAKTSGAPELEARKRIGEAGMVNSDAWENNSLIFLPNDPRYLKKIVESGHIEHEDRRYKTLDNSIGALVMHLHSAR